MRRPRIAGLLSQFRIGDPTGKRAELIATLIPGFLVTLLWALIYRHPLVTVLSVLSSFSAFFSLIQVWRERPGFPFLFPAIVMADVVAISVLDGFGSHDLIWMSGLGVYLLVSIYTAQNSSPLPFVFASIVITSFVAIGLLEISGFLPSQYPTDMRYLVLSTSLMMGLLGAITAVFHRHRLLLQTEDELLAIKESSRLNLESTNRLLEDQVRQRTSELHQLNDLLLTKTAKLQAAAEISQAILVNPTEAIEDLLTNATRLISEKLGYYHVGIFLLDNSREFAILKASNSKGGQEMLTHGHQLKVGGTGIVGYVAQSGRPRIALDTGVDAVFFNNPYLPETRSELSVPIKYGAILIGILDVQSTQSSAFNIEDENTLSTIANQLAVIIHQKGEQDSLARRRSAQEFRSFRGVEKQIGYSYTPEGSISESDEPFNPLVDRVIGIGETVTTSKNPDGSNSLMIVPVRVRDHVIGVIQIESTDSNRNWTEDEILLVQAVSDRAGLALDNAGLLEEATHRAEQEETISHITNQIGSSTDFERIMRTTIQELGLALGASRSFIQIGTNFPNREGDA